MQTSLFKKKIVMNNYFIPFQIPDVKNRFPGDLIFF